MSDVIDVMTGFMKNFQNKADLCMLAVAAGKRGESGFTFYRIDRKLGEALRGRIKEGYSCTGTPWRPEITESARPTAVLLPRNQNNHG